MNTIAATKARPAIGRGAQAAMLTTAAAAVLAVAAALPWLHGAALGTACGLAGLACGLGSLGIGLWDRRMQRRGASP